MDNFLYIIIGIVWVVYSLYTSKQKQQKKREMDAQRKSQPLPGPEPQRPRSLLEQLLDPEHKFTEPAAVAYEEYEDTEEPILSEYSDEHSYMSEYQPLEEIKSEISADYFENQYASRGEMDYYGKREALVASHEEVTQKEDLVEEFDIRKAIIYSEILKPKYI